MKGKQLQLCRRNNLNELMSENSLKMENESKVNDIQHTYIHTQSRNIPEKSKVVAS